MELLDGGGMRLTKRGETTLVVKVLDLATLHGGSAYADPYAAAHCTVLHESMPLFGVPKPPLDLGVDDTVALLEACDAATRNVEHARQRITELAVQLRLTEDQLRDRLHAVARGVLSTAMYAPSHTATAADRLAVDLHSALQDAGAPAELRAILQSGAAPAET